MFNPHPCQVAGVDLTWYKHRGTSQGFPVSGNTSHVRTVYFISASHFLDQPSLDFFLISLSCYERPFPSKCVRKRCVVAMLGKIQNMKRAAGEPSPADSLPKCTPYKHVPTHAAIDSLSCAPPGWRHMEDRKAVQAHHRRSQMSRSASGLSVVTAIDSGHRHNTNDWPIATTGHFKIRPPMPVVPGFEAMRRRSSVHASGND